MYNQRPSPKARSCELYKMSKNTGVDKFKLSTAGGDQHYISCTMQIFVCELTNAMIVPRQVSRLVRLTLATAISSPQCPICNLLVY